MKSAQWTALLVLTLMVGGITFVSVYLPDRREPNAMKAETIPPSLSFPVKVVPQEGENVLITEVGQTGHQDYWFSNESGQEVAVGLNEKGCTCSEVEITVASNPWRVRLLSDVATLQLMPRGWPALTAAAAVFDSARMEQVLPTEGAADTKVLTKENLATVPVGGIGRVRLSWRQTVVKPLVTFANIWMGDRAGLNARLEAGVRITPPLELYNKELALSSIDERELEKREGGLTAYIVCWSLTRSGLDLKAEMLHERIRPESDAITLGKPIQMEPAQLVREESLGQMRFMPVLSWYKIPVIVKPKAKDGTPIEWGRFYRLVKLSSSDPTVDPEQLSVTGEIMGDVTVGSGKEMGGVNLGSFFSKSGTHREVVLQTDSPSIELKLDTERKRDYLNASLGKPRTSPSGARLWVLRVEVPPGAASGDFPRPDNPVYRDSAIYVKTVDGKTGKPLRSIRIPVRGVANAG
jgi:hypothetical protein